ncbi:MAG: SDR family NAD(P)-dependent oxidoreductase [Chloroflexi bacterium]|nr:SDR family NAD(P)-dependent oxidoreductase [Chloroflexota bacterium]
MDLKGKVAIVTGGGTGLGEAIAMALAKDGARIVVAGRRREPLEGVVGKVKAVGSTALAVSADVTKEPDIQRLVQEALRAFGAIHVLVNNAGISGRALIKDFPTELWDAVINTNLRGPLLLIRAVLPTMVQQREGTVVNVLSNIVYSPKAAPGYAAYCASKLGLLGVTRVLANEVHEYGIRVHAVIPGNFATPIWGARKTREEIEKMAQPEDLGEAVRWLVTQPPRVNIEELTAMPFFDVSWRN